MITKTREVDGMLCSATFSDCERYRYDLHWQWDEAKPSLVAWMLNPSTATHEKLDPTVAGCRRRAEARGLGGVRVINLFAFRATDPKAMKAQDDPVGPDNNAAIAEVLEWTASTGSPVLAGWGKHGTHRNRDVEALALLRASPLAAIHAFKLNADGSPQHPLYVAHALEPVPYWSRA